MLSINVQDTPLHVVVWKGQDTTATEITQLKKRIEELEAIVSNFVSNQSAIANVPEQEKLAEAVVVKQEQKPIKSPFFKSTAVPEPVGLSVLTHLSLDAQSTAASSVNEVEVFEQLTAKEVVVPVVSTGITEKQEKRVDLNGMTFVVRKWGEDVVYCEESSGRAFLDPKDAFHEPEKHHIGYWNSEAETVSVRSEQEEEEQAKQIAEQAEEAEEAEDNKEEEEEEGVELEEFEYKGQTYYRDGDNQVYQADAEGEVDTEKAIGVWDEAKQKVLKYKV